LLLSKKEIHAVRPVVKQPPAGRQASHDMGGTVTGRGTGIMKWECRHGRKNERRSCLQMRIL